MYLLRRCISSIPVSKTPPVCDQFVETTLGPQETLRSVVSHNRNLSLSPVWFEKNNTLELIQ